METLLSLLKQIDELQLKDSYERVLNNNKNATVKELVDKVSDYANELLIGPNGQCLWDQHSVLNRAGYAVFAGERDSFGWLTGCIQTKKGIIVYG